MIKTPVKCMALFSKALKSTNATGKVKINTIGLCLDNSYI